jgi:hypothetical protein
MWEGGFTNKDSRFIGKHLVIIESPGPDFIGQIVQDPDDCITGTWESFKPLS